MTARDRMLLGVVGVLVALAGFWFLGISPKRDDVKSLDTKIAAAETRRDEAQAKAQAAQNARAQYRKDYATVARLGKAVPAGDDTASLMYQLEVAARRAKVNFRSINVDAGGGQAPAADPAAATGASGVQPKPFTFEFQGTYRQLRKLIDEVNRFARVSNPTGRLLTLDSVHLDAGSKGLPQVKAEIKAKAYVAELPAPGAAPAATGAATDPAGGAATGTPPATGSTPAPNQTAQVTP